MIIYCTYCGVPANALDHVVPVCYTENTRRTARYSRDNTVPCCNECNSTLGGKWVITIPERAEHILNRYLVKYKKIINSAEWQPHEIKELKGVIKMTVVQGMNRKAIIKDRIKCLENIMLQDGLTPLDVWATYPEDAFTKFKG